MGLERHGGAVRKGLSHRYTRDLDVRRWVLKGMAGRCEREDEMAMVPSMLDDAIIVADFLRNTLDRNIRARARISYQKHSNYEYCSFLTRSPNPRRNRYFLAPKEVKK